MNRFKALIAMPLALMAVILFPLGIIHFIAAENALSHVTLHDGGEIYEFYIAADTVEGFFYEAGIAHSGTDLISHSTDALLFDGIEISIEREVTFYVQTDGGEPESRSVRPGTTIADTVRQLQNETEIALLYNGDDETQIQNGDIISLSTWRSRFDVEVISLPYETIENYTNSVSRGRQHLRVEGEFGEEAITTAIVYIGGVEESREVVGTEIIVEPVNAILDIGTGWLGSLTNVNAPDFHYYRHVRMEATAYTAGFGCTGKTPDDPWYGITASGRRVEHGIVAVDRNVIPLGTRLYVDGYGFAVAADVGSAIRGYKIDLFMHDINDALRFGRRHIDVYILDEI
ncbi:MAG: G5 domain-containing protein [Clostridiales bacterium]|nr:G5 domain-containing protein [Clostridiales bacterium]